VSSSLALTNHYSANYRRKPVIIGKLISIQKGAGENIQFIRNNSELISNAKEGASPVTLHDTNKLSGRDENVVTTLNVDTVHK
jgi:hypothetical protein